MEEPGSRKTVGVGIHGHRPTNDAQERRSQAADFDLRKPRSFSLGTDRGLIKNLVGDPVSDPRESRLIEQDRFDGRFPRANQLGQFPDRGKAEERIVAKSEERRLVPRITGQTEAPETTGVGESESAAVVEGQFQPQETRRFIGRAEKMKTAGHAEMKDRPGFLIELEPDVLAETAGVLDGGPAQSLLDAAWSDSRENDGVGRAVRADDAPALEVAQCGLSRSLDLWEFGQGDELLDAKALEEGLDRRVPLRDGPRGTHEPDEVGAALPFDRRGAEMEARLVVPLR